jgi:glycosyltransferase involved in cell wall biosynthesis
VRTSVIVPTYNASDRLARSIETVLAQQCRPAEIIVIDDGSTDATAQTCRNFGDSILYRRTDNAGQQAARNLGASIATGDWLSLLDHDDLWDPEYLAEVDRFVVSHNIDVVWCNCRTLRETAQSATVTVEDRFRQLAPAGFWQTRGIAPDERWSVLQHYGCRDYLTFHPPQPSVTSIRRDVYHRIGGFDPRLRNNNAENMEFELRTVRSARIGIIWQPLAAITDHTASAGADTNKTIVDVVALLEFVLRHHRLTTDETDAITEAIQQRLPLAISGAFAMRDFHTLRHYAATSKPDLDWKTRIKLAIARLPPPVASRLAALLEK